jgi:hypothetical protein
MKKSGDDGVYARWLDYIGEQLIAQVEVEIGGQRIDRQYGDWMHIWNQLTMSAEQQRGYFKMIGHTTQLTYITDPTFAAISGPCSASSGPAQVCAPRSALPETTLYVPLQFWLKSSQCHSKRMASPFLSNTHISSPRLKCATNKIKCGYAPKLRESLVRTVLLNYFGNIIVAYVNHIRYSKKIQYRDNPQPVAYVRYDKNMAAVQRLNASRLERINHP